jgi:hypothetical protein
MTSAKPTTGPEWKRWVEAAKILAADPRAQVLCPRNGDAVLQVQDVADPAQPSNVERWLVCPGCGARNVIRTTSGTGS